MDTSTQTAPTTNLQGSGGIQSGAGNLQQQNSSTPYQQTSGLQQNTLGPESYKSFDGLTVQGKQQPVPAAAVGKGSADVFIGVFIVLIICAIFVYKHYKKTSTKLLVSDAVFNEEPTEQPVEQPVHHKPAKKKKNSAPKIKPKKKAAAKAKKRKK